MNMSGFGLYGNMGGGPMGGGNNVIGSGQISSATSDPTTAHMRVFVGNLNTGNISPQQIQNLFSKFGAVTGLSVHRGFAFVQYANEASARMAVVRTQNKLIEGQYIDVNIAAEPKPNQKPFSGTDSFGGGHDAAGGNYDYSNNSYGYGNFSEDLYLPKNGGFGMGGMNKNAFGIRGGRVGKGGKGRGNFANNNKKRNSFNKQMLPNIKATNGGSADLGNVDTDAIREQLISIRAQINELISIIPKSSDNAPNQEATAEVKTENLPTTSQSVMPPPQPPSSLA